VPRISSVLDTIILADRSRSPALPVALRSKGCGVTENCLNLSPLRSHHSRSSSKIKRCKGQPRMSYRTLSIKRALGRGKCQNTMSRCSRTRS
jgi:hypothetical protein